MMNKKTNVSLLKSIGVGIILFVFLRTFLFANYVVEGKSMMPTLQDGNLLMVNKISNHTEDLKRFDVIVFHANEKEDYVKRIIGLPGDTIYYVNDILYVNGQQMKEPYLAPYKTNLIGMNLTGDFTLKEVTGVKKVPKGYFFVLGDNRLHSWDSRFFGYVKMTDVVGKVNLRYWPLTEWDTQFYRNQ